MDFLKIIKNQRYILQQLFFTSFIQVFLGAANIVLISKNQVLNPTIIAFFIYFLWSINVKKIAISNDLERTFYALGGATGTGLGIFIGGFIE